ncbi:hypothetical protein BVX97_04310 [bacterium E08(2017)]|nr:hypothetical protein BVX97_04310 [bacterium E08(2017)]
MPEQKPPRQLPKAAKASSGRNMNEPTMQYYLDLLRRRVWIVFTIFTVIFTLGTIKTFKSPEIFQAVAKIIVEREIPRMINFEGVRTDGQGWDPEFYQTKADLINSRAVMDIAVLDPAVSNMFENAEVPDAGELSFFGEVRRTILSLLGGQPPPPPDAWQRLASHISCSHQEDSHFLVLKSEDVDPERAAVMAEAVAKAYEKYHYEQQAQMHGDTFQFLEKEKDKAEQLLNDAEANLQAFRKTTTAISPAGEEGTQPVTVRLNELNDQLTQVQLKRIDLESQLKVIRGLFAGKERSDEKADKLFSVPVIKNDGPTANLRAEIQAAEAELLRLKGVYGAAHPLLKSTEQKIVVLRRDFKESINTRVQTVVNELRALRVKETNLEKEYEQQKESALGLAQESFQYAKLKAEVDRHRQLFDTLVEKMSQVDLSAGYLKVNVKVVDWPSVPTSPVRPNKKRGMMLFGMLGLILGVGIAFIVEDLDDVIKTPEDLKFRLGLPVIGFIPMIDAGPIREGIPEKDAKKEAAYRHELEEEGREQKPVAARMSLTDPSSSIAEAYRHIRTNLFYSIPSGQKKVMGFVSASPAEGKTTTASNIALTIALSGRKVLLLDADFHRPMVNRVHKLKNAVGLSSVLVGEATIDEAITHIEHEGKLVEGLDVILAGPQSPNPAELLGSVKMEELLEEFRKEYDWIIIDTPPVLYVSDACIVSTLCDAIVLVVKAGKNNRSMLNRAIDQLNNVNADILGGILNMVKISKLGRHYSSYYYHGYSSYSKDYQRSYYNENRDE